MLIRNGMLINPSIKNGATWTKKNVILLNTNLSCNTSITIAPINAQQTNRIPPPFTIAFISGVTSTFFNSGSMRIKINNGAKLNAEFPKIHTIDFSKHCLSIFI